MSAKQYYHHGKTSFWSGTFRTLCGQVMPTKETRSASSWFVSVCPTCKRLKREGHRL
jgi:hypothetical protein